MPGYSTITIALPQHDIGIREVAALSARCAYVLMCFTLCWGILTATGWVRRLTGHQAIRSGHMMLAVLTLATGITHAAVFVLLREQSLSLTGLIVPFSGKLRHTAGIVGLELMVAITLAVGIKRFVNYRRWLRFHQFAYVAVALIVAHSWFGAIANGHLAVVWLGGVTVLVPAVTLTVLRWLPPRWLVRAGLLGAAPSTGLAGSRQSTPLPVLPVSYSNGNGHSNGHCNGHSNGNGHRGGHGSGNGPGTGTRIPAVGTGTRLSPVGTGNRLPAVGTGTRLPVVSSGHAGTKVRVSVDNQLCKRYGICQAESPALFQLQADGRLQYVRDPAAGESASAEAAARACPMRAIQLREVNR
ncbi:MAG: 4Fe-4S domain-containing protein [Labedaea sp.]